MAFSSEKISTDFLSLNSCGIQYLGDLNYDKIRPDGRIDYHILYIFEGKCTVHEKEEKLIAKAGDLILYKPCEMQHYSFEGADKSISCYIHFTGVKCEYYLKKFGLYENRITHIGVSKTIRNTFAKLEHENLLKRPFSYEYCTSLLLELLTLFGRKNTNLFSPGNEFESRITSIQKEMLKTAEKWLNIKYYADKCNLSVSRFQHIFKEQTGYPPGEYLMYLRFKRASSLLIETDLSITQIADILGFTSGAYFIRCFKKQTGKTPLEYRKSNR